MAQLRDGGTARPGQGHPDKKALTGQDPALAAVGRSDTAG